MPIVPDGMRQLATQVPADVYAALEGLRQRLGRSLAAEVTHALRRHLACPPSMDAPPLPPAGPDDAPRRKPGRKRKEAAP